MITIILLMASLVLTAFSSGTETAFSCASRLKAYTRLRLRKRRVRRTVKYLEKPSVFLITTLVGTNVGMVLSSSIVARWASQHDNIWLEPVSIATLSFFILIFAELIPKQFMLLSADRNIDRLALPLKLMRFILYPVIIVAEMFTKLVSGKYSKIELIKSRTEISGLISSIQGDSGKLVSRILDLDRIEVNTIVHSFDSVTGVKMGVSASEFRRKADCCNFPFILVFENDGDRLRGYISTSDILRTSGKVDEDIVKGLPYFDRNTVLMNVVSELWKTDSPMGAVIGERGQPVGIVVLDDITDYLLGEPESREIPTRVAELYWKNGNAAVR